MKGSAQDPAFLVIVNMAVPMYIDTCSGTGNPTTFPVINMGDVETTPDSPPSNSSAVFPYGTASHGQPGERVKLKENAPP